VVPTVPAVVGADPAACAEPIRGYAALYVGGMGSRDQNFYNQLAVRMGYADAAARVQDLFLARQHREAMAAVPFEFVDSTSLLGPPERIADRLAAFAGSGVTTLSVAPYPAPGADPATAAIETLRVVAEALDRSGLGD
jgi:alkanesulfonate monooxygenase SsuD/methylene tetrahydromethanopterin reductase-like flavin-dependent oxidoreductase (luciferase family)